MGGLGSLGSSFVGDSGVAFADETRMGLCGPVTWETCWWGVGGTGVLGDAEERCLDRRPGTLTDADFFDGGFGSRDCDRVCGGELVQESY